MSAVNATPIGGAAFNLLNYLYKPGISGGQSAFGGVDAGDILTLEGSDAPTADTGRVQINSPVDFTYDTVSNTTPAEAYVMRYAETAAITGPYVGGFLRFDPDFTVTTGVFIPGVFVDGGITRVGAAPGFWAYTFINVINNIENSGNFNLGNALIINIGATHRRITAGTSTVPQGTTGINFSPQTRSTIAGGVMRKIGGDIAVQVNPTWSAVGGATADLGTTVGLRAGGNSMVALGGSGAGTLIRDGVYGLDFLATTDATTGDKVVVRSALAAGLDSFFLQNNGGAISEFGAGGAHFDDNTALQFGGASFNNNDASIFWNSTGFLELFFTSTSDFLQFSSPGADRFLFDANGVAEFNFNCEDGFSLGAQTGANGNTFGNFVQGAFTVPIGGDFAGFLLTQGGNLSIGALALGRSSAWVINGLSYAAGTGSINDSDTLTVGGMVTSSPGITITERQSLNVIGGRSRLQSIIQTDPISPAALANGNNNNYAGLLTATANNGMRGWARLQGDAGGSTLTGIDAGAVQDGDTIVLTNVSANTITVTDQDANSLAANRIDLGSYSGTLADGDSCTIKYDTTSGFWRVVGANFL